MDLAQQAPSVRTRQKSRWHPSAVALSIADASRNARTLKSPMAVLHAGEVAGLVARDGFMPLTREQWAGFPSYDAVVRAYQAGKHTIVDLRREIHMWNLSNVWGDTWPCGTTPPGGTYTGTANTLRQFDNTTLGGLNFSQLTPGALETRHLTGWDLGITVNNNIVVFSLILYDRVASYDGCSITTSTTTLTNTLAAQRYISSGQDGLQIVTTASAATGATASNLSSMTVTDQQGNAGVSITPGITMAWHASAATPASALPATVVLPRDTTDGVQWTPFLPLAANVAGVRKIEAFTSSAINTGTICFALVHPMGSMWVNGGTNTNTKVDLARSMYTLERVFNTACLSFLMCLSDGNSGVIQGRLHLGHS